MSLSSAYHAPFAVSMPRSHPYKRGERVVVEGLSGQVIEVGHRWVILQLDDFSGEWAYNHTTKQLRRYERPEWLVKYIQSVRTGFTDAA